MDYKKEIMFQYISCYSLSGMTCNGVNFRGRFNTSHVTLYQSEETEISEPD